MSSSGYVNVLKWNREWFFSRRVKFDSWFHVMAVFEVSWHGRKIIYRFTSIQKWVLRLWKRPFWFSKKVNVTLSSTWSRPYQGGCSQCLIFSGCFDSSICYWKSKFSFFGTVILVDSLASKIHTNLDLKSLACYESLHNCFFTTQVWNCHGCHGVTKEMSVSYKGKCQHQSQKGWKTKTEISGNCVGMWGSRVLSLWWSKHLTSNVVGVNAVTNPLEHGRAAWQHDIDVQSHADVNAGSACDRGDPLVYSFDAGTSLDMATSPPHEDTETRRLNWHDVHDKINWPQTRPDETKHHLSESQWKAVWYISKRSLMRARILVCMTTTVSIHSIVQWSCTREGWIETEEAIAICSATLSGVKAGFVTGVLLTPFPPRWYLSNEFVRTSTLPHPWQNHSPSRTRDFIVKSRAKIDVTLSSPLRDSVQKPLLKFTLPTSSAPLLRCHSPTCQG